MCSDVGWKGEDWGEWGGEWVEWGGSDGTIKIILSVPCNSLLYSNHFKEIASIGLILMLSYFLIPLARVKYAYLNTN